MIHVYETFGPTIQGEGPHAGMKTMFLRVAGCSFKCSWCDSKYAWDTTSAEHYCEDELAEKLVQLCLNNKTYNLIITGGNPCIYDFSYIIDRLHDNDITVDVETQGDLYPDWLTKVDLLVISPKGPSSGMPDVYEKLENWLHSSGMQNPICVKIPVFNEDDFMFVRRYYDLVIRNRHAGKNIELYLSVGNTDTSEEGDISPRVLSDYAKLIDMVSKSDLKRVFVLPQIHTLIWGNKSGV